MLAFFAPKSERSFDTADIDSVWEQGQAASQVSQRFRLRGIEGELDIERPGTSVPARRQGVAGYGIGSRGGCYNRELCQNRGTYGKGGSASFAVDYDSTVCQ